MISASMIRLDLKLPESSYPLFIGEGAVRELPSFLKERNYSSVVILTDTNVGPLIVPMVQKHMPQPVAVITVPAGESHKSVETLAAVWTHLQEKGTDRKSLLLNVGGGVIGDLGGFAASTYMRGIDFVQVPTSLLAQVDASVGGKTGIDHNDVKNLVGTFTQPKAVVIDINFLRTLPSREYISGFAEIIKHGIIADPESFELASVKSPRDFSGEELTKLIHLSCSTKARIVEKDEIESGLRKLLNFGHTAGHAIESLALGTTTPLTHGEAVSIGMVIEAKLSQLLGKLHSKDFKRIEDGLIRASLPTRYEGAAPKEEIWRLIRSDKKSTKGEIAWALPTAIGHAEPEVIAPENLVTEALKFALPKYV